MLVVYHLIFGLPETLFLRHLKKIDSHLELAQAGEKLLRNSRC